MIPQFSTVYWDFDFWGSTVTRTGQTITEVDAEGGVMIAMDAGNGDSNVIYRQADTLRTTE
jgi:hypothetical protein